MGFGSFSVGGGGEPLDLVELGAIPMPEGGKNGQALVKTETGVEWADVGGGSSLKLHRIYIDTPPTKTAYKPGEVFDPAGMVVKADYAQNGVAVVKGNEVTGYTYPTDGLASGVTSVTITYAEGGVVKTANVAVSSIAIYGAEWDGTSTSKLSRTDVAAEFTDPVPYVSGATTYGSPFDNLMPWVGMVKSERVGGTMVSIPKFWYKLTQTGSKVKIQIADGPADDFHVSPAHMDRGDGKGERDVVYIGRYHCADGIYKSTSGLMPQAGMSRAKFRTNIHDLGDTIWQSDFAMRFTLWLLYIVEFADWNSQSAIGKGCGNDSAEQKMGYTDNMPYHTGTTKSSRDNYGLGTQYRNIEGLWDNVYDWCDGCYSDSSGLNIILNPANFGNSGGVSAGTPANGWIAALKVAESGLFPTFINGGTSGGSEATYVCDCWKSSKTAPSVYAGGSYSQSGDRGLFYIDYSLDGAFPTAAGSRLQELP